MLENETGRTMASGQQHSLPFDALVESPELPSIWRPSFRRSKGEEMIDPNVLNSEHVPSRSTVLDVALQIGLGGFLIYACSRYISPFSDLLLWSAILAVMLYPLHLRLAVRIGNRW